MVRHCEAARRILALRLRALANALVDRAPEQPHPWQQPPGNSSPLCQRSAGCFSSARMTAPPSLDGTSGRTRWRGAGRSAMCFETTTRLGAHVGRRADRDPLPRRDRPVGVARSAGDAEVGQQCPAAGGVQQHVLGLDVPMNEAGPARGPECGGDVGRDRPRVLRRERALPVESLARALSGDLVDDVKQDTSGCTGVMDGCATFTATRRSRARSVAWKTTPIPPRPSSRSSRYWGPSAACRAAKRSNAGSLTAPRGGWPETYLVWMRFRGKRCAAVPRGSVEAALRPGR